MAVAARTRILSLSLPTTHVQNRRSRSSTILPWDLTPQVDSSHALIAKAQFAPAIKLAQPGDVVIIAGRGHEKDQQIGNRNISFDDRRVTRRLLLELLTGVSSEPLSHRSAISA